MPTITLPDQKKLKFDHPVSVFEVAENIGAGLAKAALAARVNDQIVDTSFVIKDDATVAIITNKSPEGLDIIRHSTAHLMAHAVKQIFPHAQVTIGPVIENGFFYDFAIEPAFSPEDLEKIEKRMEELVKLDIPIKRIEMPRNDAIEFFRNQEEYYKAEIIAEIPEEQQISLYQQADFTDLCRGPHVPNTSHLKAFKLTKIAGAYWRGDSNNKMLQRIYGTAFGDKKELKTYLHCMEEAGKRDHRKIGRALHLFHFQEEAPGMCFWHAKGWQIVQTVIQYMRSKLAKYDYQEVSAPLIMDKSLWEKSGHWEKFGEEGMFSTQSENRHYVIKPMNCPGHIQIFKQGLKSYRDLPLRMGEFGLCHRNEPSGTLHGLLRIRGFTQDDAHVFCTPDQLQPEINQLIDIVYEVYKDFGFTDIKVRLATRPDKRIGADEVWGEAEKALELSLTNRNIEFEWAPGEGAFYGPKIEFHLRDCIDRVWQCGTIQVDFSMPGRLGAEYVAEDGSRQVPIMIHRAILGSIERFVGMLIEHYAGLFPPWLAPIQVVVMDITDRQAEYAAKVVEKLKKHGIKVISDLRNEKIGFKIREHTLQKIPYLLVVGDRELEEQTVAVRTHAGEDLGSFQVNAFIDRIQAEIESKL